MFKSEERIIQIDESLTNGSILHILNLRQIGQNYVRYPDTFLMGLSRIGGLIAFYKIVTILMKLSHRSQFERQVVLPTSMEKQQSLVSQRNYSINEFTNEDSEVFDINRTLQKKDSSSKVIKFGETFSFERLGECLD